MVGAAVRTAETDREVAPATGNNTEEKIIWLGRQVIIQTFEDDVECDIEEIRQLMEEDSQDPEQC